MQVARALKPNSEVQQAVLLLRKYCSGGSPTVGMRLACALPACHAVWYCCGWSRLPALCMLLTSRRVSSDLCLCSRCA